MNSIRSYYNQKALGYGMSGLRQKHLLELIGPMKGKKILDVGCASGYFGKLLRQRGNTVYGIDISQKAVKQARKVLDKAYCVDLENDPLPFLNTFDVIVIAEVLEHLFQPQAVVEKLVKRLKPQGKLIITTPNISYWVNRLNFFFGKFEYTNQGMFDEGHIHFFNDPSLKMLIKNVRLRISKENHVIIPITLRFVCKYFPNVFAYQLIIAAQRR